MNEPSEMDRHLAAAFLRGLVAGSFFVLPFLLALQLIGPAFGRPMPAYVRFHVTQWTALHAAFGFISIATCGVGFVVLAFPVWWWTWSAADVVARGEYAVAPIVGRWFPRPQARGE